MSTPALLTQEGRSTHATHLPEPQNSQLTWPAGPQTALLALLSPQEHRTLATALLVNPPLQIAQAVFPEFCLAQPAQCSCSSELSIQLYMQTQKHFERRCTSASLSTGQHSVSKNGEESFGENKVTCHGLQISRGFNTSLRGLEDVQCLLKLSCLCRRAAARLGIVERRIGLGSDLAQEDWLQAPEVLVVLRSMTKNLPQHVLDFAKLESTFVLSQRHGG